MTITDVRSATTSELSAGSGKSRNILHGRIAERNLQAREVTDVTAEKHAEITLLRSQLTVKDTRLQATSMQIAGFGKRLREANLIVLQGRHETDTRAQQTVAVLAENMNT